MLETFSDVTVPDDDIVSCSRVDSESPNEIREDQY